MRLDFTLAGMLVGYLLVHPVAMLAYTLGPQHARLTMDFSFWARELRLAFSLGMVHMGVAFAVMGEWPVFFLGSGMTRKNAG